MFPTAVSWALRLICAVLLVAVRDEEMDFTVLAECGAAFWLVMDSNDLFKALSHVLRHGAPWPGRIRIYKASLQRMMETMSISYRWQPNSVTLDEKGTNINMSTWQLQTVLDALAHSTCRCTPPPPPLVFWRAAPHHPTCTVYPHALTLAHAAHAHIELRAHTSTLPTPLCAWYATQMCGWTRLPCLRMAARCSTPCCPA